MSSDLAQLAADRHEIADALIPLLGLLGPLDTSHSRDSERIGNAARPYG
jgi:hypothetical protein